MNPKSPRSPLHFYALPRPVAVQIFTLLPLASILACTQASRRIHTLITRCPELRTHLFHEPPPPPSAVPTAAAPAALHPVFSRLSFSAFHSAKAIRLAAGDGRFLVTCDVRHRFATAPALAELVVRVISGGEWPLDVEIAVSNKDGVTVWDVVDGVTGFFNGFSQISFGEHFGADFCTEHEWDPKALMHNHEFLNPELPFPTIYIPDRERSNVFNADYAFNEFASVPLVLRPLAWRRQWSVVQEVDMVEKARRAEAEKAAAAAEESSVESDGDTQPVEETSSVGEPEAVKPDEDIKPPTDGKKEHPEQAEEPADAETPGSMGSQSMSIDNDAEPRCGHPSNPGSPNPATTTEKAAAATHEPQQEAQPQPEPYASSRSFTSDDTMPLSTSGSDELPSHPHTPHKGEKEKEKEKENHTRPVQVLSVPEMSAPPPVSIVTDAALDVDSKPPDRDLGTLDWGDAFD